MTNDTPRTLTPEELLQVSGGHNPPGCLTHNPPGDMVAHNPPGDLTGRGLAVPPDPY